MTRQPALSFSVSFQDHFNRAGGRTSNVREKSIGPVPANKHWTSAGHPRKRRMDGTMWRKGVMVVDFARQSAAVVQLADVQKQAGEFSEEDRKGLVACLLYEMSGLPAGPDDDDVGKREAEMGSGAVIPAACFGKPRRSICADQRKRR